MEHGPIKIKVNLNVDPRLDPNSPKFDLQAWEDSMLQFEGRLAVIKERLAEIVGESLTFTDANLKDLSATLSELANSMLSLGITDTSGIIKQIIFDLAESLQRDENQENVTASSTAQRDFLYPTENSNLLLQRFLPMLNGNPTNTIMGMSTKYLSADGITGVATYKKNGQTIKVKDFSEVSAHLGTSAKKLMDISVLYLTSANFYGGGTVNPTAVIPLDEYWRAQGYPVDPVDDTPKELARAENLVKWLKKNTRADCQAIKSISWEGYTGTGKNKTQEASYYFISSWRFLRGNRLKINFDIDLATYLIHAYQMQFPVVLLALDNRKPNSYAIGRKIAFHHSIDNNAIAGTDNTISVKSLLASAPEIPSYEVVTAKKQGSWKNRIKKKLEAALDDNIAIGFLSRWEYRDSRAKTVIRYTPETAAALCWEEYHSLVIDFTLLEEPNQERRRAKRAIEKTEASKKPVKKRGRPKKTEKKG